MRPYRSHGNLYRGTPDEGSPAEKMSLGTFFPTPSCVFLTIREFRPLRRASQGSALTTRKPLKRLDLNFASLATDFSRMLI
jgi:hypothetical protein